MHSYASTPMQRSFFVFAAGVLLPVILIFAVIKLIGLHFEDHFAMYKMIVYETRDLTKNFHYMNDIMGWETAIGKMQHLFPSISWWSVFVTGSVAGSFILLHFIILKKSIAHGHPSVFTGFLLSLLWLFFFWNLFWVHHNRAAFFLAGSSLLCSTAYSEAEKNRSYYWKNQLLFLVFAAGVFWRMEAGIVSFLLLLPMLALRTSFNFKNFFRAYGAHTAFIIILLSVYFFKTYYHPDFYYALEPETEYELSARGNVVPLSAMKTPQDSMKYIAVTKNWMLGDIQTTTPGYIRSLISKPSDQMHRYFFFLFPKSGTRTEINLSSFFVSNTLLLLNLLFLLCLFAFARVWRSALLLSGYALFGIVLLLSSFTVEGMNRVIEPFIFLLVAAVILVANERLQFKAHPAFSAGCLLLTLINLSALGKETLNARSLSNELCRNESDTRQKTDKYINTSGRSIVLPVMDFSVFNTGVFVPYNGFPGKKLLFFEYGQFSASPHFLKTIAAATGCTETDFGCRLRYLNDHKENFIVIARPKVVDFMEQYARKMYDIPLQLKRGSSVELNEETTIWFPE